MWLYQRDNLIWGKPDQDRAYRLHVRQGIDYQGTGQVVGQVYHAAGEATGQVDIDRFTIEIIPGRWAVALKITLTRLTTFVDLKTDPIDIRFRTFKIFGSPEPHESGTS